MVLGKLLKKKDQNHDIGLNKNRLNVLFVFENSTPNLLEYILEAALNSTLPKRSDLRQP